MIIYPGFDPIAFRVGPIKVHWYGIMYLLGFASAWFLARRRAAKPESTWTPNEVDDLIFYCMLGVILGGRIGYVLFYQFDLYRTDPLEIIRLWHGGMSFHGGCAGVTIAMILFCRSRKIPLFAFSDIVASAVPLGLFFGRLANFVNGELWGRPTDVPWAMVFPTGGPEPRHPSQLYEAGLEGLGLFAIALVLDRLFKARTRPGIITGAFLIGYAVARSVSELFREPDKQLGFLIFGTTMGQLLSIPLLIGGIWLILRAKPVTTTVTA